MQTVRSSLSRNAIKAWAMLAMALNHVAATFLPSGTFWCEALTDVGYFTAITMCYFLVEGYAHTRSKPRYALRLLVFALLSQLPYCLAFTQEGLLEPCALNMMFTLLLCFLMLWALDRVRHPVLRWAATAAPALLTAFCDWALLAPVFVLLFVWAGNSHARLKTAYVLSAVLFGLVSFLGGMDRFSPGLNALYALGGIAGLALSGLCVIYCYSGQRGRSGPASKWFFYIFYPAHLLVLGVLRLALTL